MAELLKNMALSVKPAKGKVEIKSKLKYTANGPYEPHWTCKLASIIVGEKKVGYIEYGGDPNESKEKEIEIILN